MRDVVILQHADWELPGAYGDLLAGRGLPGRVIRADLGEELPDVREIGAVIAMGGPMSVNDDLPWIHAERQFALAATAAGVPFLGTCLGAQLLAAAYGAAVRPGPHPEYGVVPVTLTVQARDDLMFAGLPDRIDVFQWHGETFELPAGAVRLTGSYDYPNQAFRIGRSAYGLQFHLEITPDLLATWLAVPQCRAEAERHLGHDAAEQLTKQVQDARQDLHRLARHVFDRWLTTIPDLP